MYFALPIETFGPLETFSRQIQYITQSLGLFAMETYVIKDGKLYTISFSAPESRVPEILPIAKNMTQSFQFTA